MPKATTPLELKLLAALREITSYMTPRQIRKDCDRGCGLDYEEYLEMAYENVLNTAKRATKGVTPSPIRKAQGDDVRGEKE